MPDTCARVLCRTGASCARAVRVACSACSMQCSHWAVPCPELRFARSAPHLGCQLGCLSRIAARAGIIHVPRGEDIPLISGAPRCALAGCP